MVGDNFCKQKPRGKISKVRRKSGFSIFALSTRMYSDCRRMRWDCQFLRMLRSTTNSQSWLDKTCCYARCTDPNFMRNVSLDSWWNRDSSKYSYSYREQQLQMWQYGKLGTTKAHHQPQNTTEVPPIGRGTRGTGSTVVDVGATALITTTGRAKSSAIFWSKNQIVKLF